MKKRIVSTVLIIVFCMTCVSAATIIGDISYWYSNDSKIASWQIEPVVSATGTANCPANFSTNVSTGFGAWSYAGIPNSYSSDFDSADIPVYGGPYTEIKEVYPTFPTTATGVTDMGIIYLGEYVYNSTYKGGYEVVEAEMYIATDKANSKTYKHEAGHALGWLGHSTSSADIMYGTQTSVTSLTSRDINHLAQIY